MLDPPELFATHVTSLKLSVALTFFNCRTCPAGSSICVQFERRSVACQVVSVCVWLLHTLHEMLTSSSSSTSITSLSIRTQAGAECRNSGIYGLLCLIPIGWFWMYKHKNNGLLCWISLINARRRTLNVQLVALMVCFIWYTQGSLQSTNQNNL